ncbi:MAG TPA: DNA polymerase III subunit beta [Bacteroidales bacterium]|nr:DNA polymerase III subunit beta [Bacteroidales bacterium]HPR56887.1 DNA polymerase III subunit beta [Bacteroidales bacterium]HRW96065.1 DNA polymerase III subunit beta [Bacteroidales bacterium]
MKFIVSSTFLLKNLQAISGVLVANNSLPILDDFLFNLNDDDLKITTSDIESTMTVQIKVTMADEPGIVAIPAKILLETLKTLPDVPVTFDVNQKTFAIKMMAGDGEYNLNGHNGEDFPETPVIDDGNEFTINSIVLSEAISKTVFAASNDEMRPVMTGVFLEMTPENTSFVATDAHKLVRYTRKDITVETEDSFIIPTKPLNQIKNLLGVEDQPVKIIYNRKNTFFSFGRINLISKLIEGKYPNYVAVIPTDNPNKLQIERTPLLNAIKRVSIYASQSTHQLRFSITGRQLIISGEDADFNNKAREILTCNYDGEDMDIGFNSKFLSEMLNNLDSGEVMFEMSQPNRASLIKPIYDEDRPNEDILMLIMPLMLND